MFPILSSKIKRTSKSETFIVVFHDNTLRSRLTFKFKNLSEYKIRLNSVYLLAKEVLFYVENMSFDARFSGRMRRMKRILQELTETERKTLSLS